ncbi:MAG TPA: site-2 protease family protein [Clostridiales bacterium]|nr:site-2 protease family protein [Clostridiales bacterium]
MIDIIISKLLILPGILIGLSVHEFAHAYVAYKLGDDSQRFQGRLTLDPTKHIDPLGFLFLLLVGFGWAKPVMVNSRMFKNPRRDDSLVSVAGPLMNLITAILFTVILGLVLIFIPNSSQIIDIVITIITGIIQINLVLMVFNLIPIPPLDGHHIFGNIFGAPVWNFYYKYADMLRIGLMLIIILGGTSFIISPIVESTYEFLISNMLKIVSGII